MDHKLQTYLETKYPGNDKKYVLYRNELKKDILTGIGNGSITPKNVDTMMEKNDMRICHIASNNFRYLIDNKATKEKLKETISYTSAYVCKKCGGNKSHVTYLQTRSADEPMTAFIKCMDCNHMMRQ